MKTVEIRDGEHLVVHRDGQVEHHRDGRVQWVEIDHIRAYWPQVLPELDRVLAELQ
jgi:hypothetical protein